MGNMRRLPDGQDFSAEHFAQEKDFGFSGSAEGYDEHPVAPPFAGSKPDTNPGHHDVEPYAHGGGVHHLHPHGHHVTHVEHHPHGVVMHHAHGGMTVHHHDGHVSHHDAKGGMVHHGAHHGEHHPGEGTHVAKLMAAQHAEPDGDEGMARGGHASAGRPQRIPRSLRPKAESGRSPINDAPRNPQRSVTPRNQMPAGQMPMGVEPGSEPDEAGSEQGIPQLKHGGRAHRRHFADGGEAMAPFTGTPSPALREAAEEANTRYLNTNQGSGEARSSDPSVRWGKDSNVNTPGGKARGGRC